MVSDLVVVDSAVQHLHCHPEDVRCARRKQRRRSWSSAIINCGYIVQVLALAPLHYHADLGKRTLVLIALETTLHR